MWDVLLVYLGETTDLDVLKVKDFVILVLQLFGAVKYPC